MFISQIVNQFNSDVIFYNRDYFHNHLSSVSTGGRIISIRSQRTLFMTISWGQHNIQIMCESTNSCHSALSELHVGDIIEIDGHLTRSLRGELSIIPSSVNINSRTLHNIELRRDFDNNSQNLREVNLMRNTLLMNNMVQRSRIIQQLRQYMFENQFLEVETPILHDNPSGASARTFETDCFANNHHYHLRIAPEIYLVRTLMSGFEQIFEIGHNFRNEGISNRHQPEFTMLECYRAFSDNSWAMNFVEQLLNYLGQQFNCNILNQSFLRMSFIDALIEYHPEIGVNRRELAYDRAWLMAHLPTERHNHSCSIEMLQFQVFETIDHLIINPTFITGHPIEISPLAKSIDGTNSTERFELFINGRELGNGFSQLIDVTEQQLRFDMQSANHVDDAMRTDHTYIQSMEYAYPRIGGFGIGIDRLVMLLTNQNDIRDIVLFPV